MTLVTAWLLISVTLRMANHSSAGASDLISCEWEGAFEIGGASAMVTLNFKLDRETLSGTGRSEHTGPGIISEGSMVANKLKFTLNFEKHESVAVDGSLQGEQLSGEFRTEDMIGKWSAKRKNSAKPAGANPGSGSGGASSLSSEVLTGDWDATFEARGTKVPVTLKLRIAGDQISGTSESEHLGAGKISKGSYAGDKLNFVIDGSFGSISVSSVLHDGSLEGEFDMGTMHGKFAAKKK
jgi:hypothetical protein